jgi:hypothetical protein
MATIVHILEAHAAVLRDLGFDCRVEAPRRYLFDFWSKRIQGKTGAMP